MILQQGWATIKLKLKYQSIFIWRNILTQQLHNFLMKIHSKFNFYWMVAHREINSLLSFKLNEIRLLSSSYNEIKLETEKIWMDFHLKKYLTKAFK